MDYLPKDVTRRLPGKIEIACRTVFAVSVIAIALVGGGLLGFLAIVFSVVARAVRRVLGMFR